MELIKKIKKIRLSWKHILVIFLILILFQLFVSRLQQNTLSSSISETMEWSKQNSAEQIGNLTAATIEILVELIASEYSGKEDEKKIEIIHAFNSILKQPLMNRSVETVSLIVPDGDRFVVLDIGRSIFNYFHSREITDLPSNIEYTEVLKEYKNVHKEIKKTELTTSIKNNEGFYYVFVPLVPHGEYSGSVFFKVRPNVTFISKQVLSSFNQTVLIFSTLILVGLVMLLLVSTLITIERDEARELLYVEREKYLSEHIAQQKEHLFTKRIYHTHHKAEKVMGFINEDLDNVSKSNFDEVRYRITKYANFIARVIYDMKWFNPPIHTMRGNLFNTDLNELLHFIVKNIFQRVSNPVNTINFIYDLDETIPKIRVNEFVMWEIIEPLIQNSIDHTDKENLDIKLSTKYYNEDNYTLLTIIDNGPGIAQDLLQIGENGVKNIFQENISTKSERQNHGYGCYISYEIASRCGWEIDAKNNDQDGSTFYLKINHYS